MGKYSAAWFVKGYKKSGPEDGPLREESAATGERLDGGGLLAVAEGFAGAAGGRAGKGETGAPRHARGVSRAVTGGQGGLFFVSGLLIGGDEFLLLVRHTESSRQRAESAARCILNICFSL